jgi:hypothetical protein
MKIYRVSWFDEDFYGPTRMLYYIVQAGSEHEALTIARENATDNVNGKGIEEKELDEYEKLEVEDISDQKILTSGLGGIGG